MAQYPTYWKSSPKNVFVPSEEDRAETLLFLNKEAELDAINYQMMLDTVDINTLTKGKINALGKLGKQYNKASKAIIKAYKEARINTTLAKEKTWIKSI